jgi:hypothetical protein
MHTSPSQIPNASQTFYEFEDTWKNFYSLDPTAGEFARDIAARVCRLPA